MMMGGSSSSSSKSQLLKIGLEFGDGAESEGGVQKKGRGGGGPRCQVEGCNLDLSDAKTYYARHKVCCVHSKTAMVIVNGLEQRFCQQCSRFHQLPEFDQGKRSCRRRLAGHNERRRKPVSGTLLSARYGSLPSSNFENNGNSGGFFMDFSSCSRAPTAMSNLDNLPPYIHPNAPPGPGGCFNGVQDSNRALSLLSNHSSASRIQPLTHEYYANPYAGAHMVQQPTGTMVQGQGHFSTGWGYDTDEAHLGLGLIPESGYPGEIGLRQQGGRRLDSSVDHTDWSL